MPHSLTRCLLIASVLALTPTRPAAASQDEVKRELERLGLPETLSIQRDLSSQAAPEHSSALTIAAPLSVIALSSTLGYPGLAVGAIAAPLTMGAGHFHAGAPVKGTLVSLGGPAVMVGSFLACYALGEPLVDPNVRYMRGLGPGLIGSLIVTTGYWIWAAFDAGETARQKQREALSRIPGP